MIAGTQTSYSAMNALQEIHRQLDVLTAAAESRMRQTSNVIVAATGGATIDYMTPDERAERHALMLQLPSYAEEREAARQRLQARRRERGKAHDAHPVLADAG